MVNGIDNKKTISLKTTQAYKAPLYKVTEETATLHVSQGNSKVGKDIYTFSTLPGNLEHMLVIKGKDGAEDQLLSDIPGTCSKYCDACFNNGCYAVNSARLHHNAVIQAWAENTLLLRSGRVWNMIDDFITKKNAKETKVKIWRINVSGELESVDDIKHWDELATKHPEVRFSVYTKNYDAVEAYMNKLAGEGKTGTQPNFIINISQWHHCADAFLAKYPKRSFNVFTYDDSNRKNAGADLSDTDREVLSQLVHCPAVTKDGRHAKKPDGNEITCSECQRCYRKTGAETAVYAH